MNLTGFFKRDAAINDLSWMQTSGLARVDDPILDISGMKNPNNIKPELEMEWGGGMEINMDEPAGTVQRNIPKENLGDADAVIFFARDLMNKGLRGRQVAASLKKRFPSASLANASRGLRAMFALEGLVGRVMVDARGYKSCQAAIKATANSPYKRFVKYVYGCSCGDPHCIPVNETGLMDGIQESSGNGFDDFMASGSGHTASMMVSHCRSTMLPVIAAMGDLDKSYLDETMTEMMNMTALPEGVVKGIRAMDSNNLSKARAAFRWLDKQADDMEDAQYSGPVNSGEFALGQADNEIDFFSAPMADIEVDSEVGQLAIDTPPLGDVDIDFSENLAPEFQGIDEVELGEVVVPPVDLEVDGRQDWEI